jgi:NAD(P)H-nitrite reductase large subunit
VLAGRIERHDLSWRADAYLADDLRVRVLSGVRATELRSDAGPLVLGNGMELTFDALVLATGARPVIPAIPGAALAGVSPLRNLDDLEAIEGLIAPGRRAVVLGGGNVGLQVCEALRSRGMNVTVVVTSPHLLSQMVDAEVGCRVAKLFTDHGVTVRTGRDATEIVGSAQVEAVRLDDGELIGADLVVVGKGIRPNVEWLRGSGITIGTGIVVDPCGRTSVPGIFAAGDCAEVTDPLTGRPALSGIWPIAYEVGRAAGSAAVGVDRPSRGPLRMNASRFFGVPVISIGEVLPDRLEGGSAQVLVDREASYRKLVHCRGRLAGALLYGDVSGAGILYRLYREGVDVGDGIAAELEEKRLESVLAPLIAAAGTDRPDAPPGVAHGE